MKKKVKIIIASLIAVPLIAAAVCSFPFTADIDNSILSNNITLHYDGETCKPDAEEIKTLCKIFKNKQTFFEASYCGHTSEYCIKAGTLTIMPACDGCGMMKCNSKYTNLNDSEREKIDAIFASHFDCYRPQNYL